jgi:hypothetical protein
MQHVNTGGFSPCSERWRYLPSRAVSIVLEKMAKSFVQLCVEANLPDWLGRQRFGWKIWSLFGKKIFCQIWSPCQLAGLPFNRF